MGMTSCVINYNGGLLKKKYRKEYKQFMKKLNFGALTKVLSTMTKAYCKNDCNDDFDSQLIYLAKMLDNSLQPEGKGECSHFRHLSDTIMDLVSDISKYDFDTSPFDEDKFVNWLIQRSTALPKSFWCGREDCVDSLAENFNTCCSKNAISMVVNKKILKAGLKWFKSLIENLGEDMPNLTKKTQKSLLKAGNPAKMCRKYYKSDNSCSNATIVV